MLPVRITWAGAEIGEIAVAIDRDLLVFRNVLDDIELEFARVGARTERAQFTALGHGEGVGAREFDALEGVVGLRFLFHLRLDLPEVLGRDAVRQFDVVVKPFSTGGPPANCASGQWRRIAVARTCAHECRIRSRSVIGWSACAGGRPAAATSSAEASSSAFIGSSGRFSNFRAGRKQRCNARVRSAP